MCLAYLYLIAFKKVRQMWLYNHIMWLYNHIDITTLMWRLANGWLVVGQWLADCWPMAGQWLANGLPIVGKWLNNGWPMVGQGQPQG